MDCNKAGLLMMSYMDGVLSEQDGKKLNAHLAACGRCLEDFTLYDALLTDFHNQRPQEAPEGFEAAVMERITALPQSASPVRPGINFDYISSWIWGCFSVIAGIGFIIFLNRDAILTYALADPLFAPALSALLPAAEQTAVRLTSLFQSWQNAFLGITGFFADQRYPILCILGVLALIQYFIYKKDKVKA